MTDVNPVSGHENPIDVSDVTDEQRAAMLLDYLDVFRSAFGRTPKLMPLDSEGKAPWITGRCALDSAEADAALVDGYEAARRIHHDGARGFAIYAGRASHGTEGVAFVDHDDTDAFPAPTAEPTLEVLSGSGRGEHETYRNDPSDRVRNARVTGENGEAGEIRAENWYVVTPGSVHPSGGVYHVVEDRPIATLSDADLTDDMRSNAKRREGRDPRQASAARDADGASDAVDDESVRERLEAAFECSPTGEKYQAIYNGRYASAGYSDRSAAEYALANWVDMWVGFGDRAVVGSVLDAGNLQKWSERTDAAYRDSVLANVGFQDWYADDEVGGKGNEHVAVVPNAPVSLAEQNACEWDWRAARSDEGGGDLSIDSARRRTREAIGDAYENGDRVLIEALPTMGKSFGATAAAADTGQPVSYLTNRGNDEQYQRARDRCERFDLSYYTLPSAWRDCPCFRGDHGDGVKEDVRGAYYRGTTAKEIHIHAGDLLGYELPCQAEGETCGWRQKWSFDPEEFDVLIGHYSHAHVLSAVSKRTVVFDEFPGDTFETQFGGEQKHRDVPLSGPVSHFLKNTPTLAIDDYADLMAAREDSERRADALGWFLSSEQPGRDAGLAFGHGGHALAPIAAFVLLAGAENDLGNGWERVDLEDVGGEGWVGLYNREQNAVHINETPSFQYASGVVALDGTPTRQMWESALGTRFNTRQVLADAERVEYLRDVLGHRYVRTTDWVKPYSSGEHVNVRYDAAVLDWIREEYDRKPALITTQNAKGVYHADDSIEFALDSEGDVIGTESCVDTAKHYGNLLGSNDFKRERLGAVVGSRNLGDGFVKKWAAYAGEATERVDATEAGKGTNLQFTGVGRAIHRHMTEHQTLQAAMRFGRDGNGAVVFVHTNTLPEWVEPVVTSEGRVVRTRSNGERQVLEALGSSEFLDAHPDGWTTADVARFPGVEISERQVRTHLTRLAERGHLNRRVEGNGYVWRDDGLHRVNEHGEVELEAVGLDELGGVESAEVARTLVNTWSFRTSSDSPNGSAVGSTETDRSALTNVADGGGSTLHGD